MGTTEHLDEQPTCAPDGGRVDTASAFVSYAQDYEDLRLWYALRHIEAGTYVDVGAQDPDAHTVTRAFYERGWSGINIEPVAIYHEKLERARPRDVNLRVAAAASAGECDFFEIGESGLSTLRDDIAQRHLAAGFKVARTRVNVRPLRDLWTEFVRGEVHFLKIDVEGAEKDVLAGADLRGQRPWIVVIEATVPMTGIPTHDEWESLLTTAGYRFALSDDLNRYYVADEHAQLAEALRDAPIGPQFGRSRHPDLTALLQKRSWGEPFDPARSLFLGLSHATPTLRSPQSQLCTESQLGEPAYGVWCDALREAPALHYHQWERVYILQALAVRGMLEPLRRGLGFGSAPGPLAAVMTGRGCEIVVTERASRMEDGDRVSPELGDFDFVWSSGVVEHMGSIRRAVDFVVEAMRYLRRGGVAVHTIPFNLTSNYQTVEGPDLVVFRRYDLEQLIQTLERAGHAVGPPNLNPGSGPADCYVDLPPYRGDPHLRVRHDRYVLTSLGLIVARGG
jgi:FkbM family methyltransferase